MNVLNHIHDQNTPQGTFKSMMSTKNAFIWVKMPRSRSEQAPGSVFHPRDESGKIE